MPIKTFFLSLLVLFPWVQECNNKLNNEPPKENPAQVFQNIPFEIIAKGTQSNFEEGAEITITSEEKLREVFEQINATRTPGIEMRKVNFEKEMVFFWSSQQLSHGGPVPQIESVVKTESQIIVQQKKVEIDPTQPVTTVLSTPFVMLKLERYGLPVVFQ